MSITHTEVLSSLRYKVIKKGEDNTSQGLFTTGDVEVHQRALFGARFSKHDEDFNKVVDSCD